MVKEEKIVSKFRTKQFSIKEISMNFSIPSSEIKRLLKEKLGEFEYNHVSRSIGAFKINKKFEKGILSRTEFGKKVSLGIKSKMKDQVYYKKWLKKTKLASKKARIKVRSLLKENSRFRREWIKNCSKGGTSSYIHKKGAHDIKYRKNRMIGSIKGLKNTTRKLVGPRGEHMYNHLEKQVASLLFSKNLNYEYEKIFHVNNANGHISCDFVINNLFIEVTYWDKIKEKSAQLNAKFSIFKKFEKGIIPVLITTTIEFKEEYKRYLDKNILIFTFVEFKEWINKRDSGRRI